MNAATSTETNTTDFSAPRTARRLPLHDRLILTLFLIAFLLFGVMSLGDMIFNLLR